MRDARRARADFALIAHQLRDRERQDRRQIGEPGEAVDHIEAASDDVAGERRRIAHRRQLRAAAPPGPTDAWNGTRRFTTSRTT